MMVVLDESFDVEWHRWLVLGLLLIGAFAVVYDCFEEGEVPSLMTHLRWLELNRRNQRLGHLLFIILLSRRLLNLISAAPIICTLHQWYIELPMRMLIRSMYQVRMPMCRRTLKRHVMMAALFYLHMIFRTITLFVLMVPDPRFIQSFFFMLILLFLCRDGNLQTFLICRFQIGVFDRYLRLGWMEKLNSLVMAAVIWLRVLLIFFERTSRQVLHGVTVHVNGIIVHRTLLMRVQTQILLIANLTMVLIVHYPQELWLVIREARWAKLVEDFALVLVAAL